MSRLMASMFPEIPVNERGVPLGRVDNLTEIPIPSQTRHQRFLTIAESEPFGPIDASKVLNIEPASETLQKLTTETQEAEDSSAASSRDSKGNVVFYSQILDGEKTKFRFTSAKVGQVGHRYGASKDDRKHARKVKFIANGQMVYA